MVKVLNRLLPFGEVRGAPGIAYVQEERMFDHLGREVHQPQQSLWNKMLNDPQLAQRELTLRAATNTVQELESLPHVEVRRIAHDEYGIHTGRSSKEELIRKIHDRIMERA